MVKDETSRASRDHFVKNFLYHAREPDTEITAQGSTMSRATRLESSPLVVMKMDL